MYVMYVLLMYSNAYDDVTDFVVKEVCRSTKNTESRCLEKEHDFFFK